MVFWLVSSVKVCIQCFQLSIPLFFLLLESHVNTNYINEGQTGRIVKTEERKEGGKGTEKEPDRIEKVPAYKEAPSQKPVFSSKEKYIYKPVSELDLSNCQRCTPSYRLLPKHVS